MRRRRWAAAACAALAIAGIATTAAFVDRGDGAAGVATRETVPASTTTTSTPPTTTTLAPLPVPDPPPEDPYADVPVQEIGAISIPKIGVEHTVYEGIWLTVLNVGPGHWPNTALPGQRGNTVFPGHRTTFSKPFRELAALAPGDEVIFRMPDGDHTYRVRETIIVEPTDLWVVDQTETATFTLVACHPLGSAAQRIVVKGDHVTTNPATRPLST